MHVPIALKLSAAFYDRLEHMAQARRLSVPTLIEQILEAGVSAYEDDQAREAFSNAHPAPGPDEARRAFAQRTRERRAAGSA